MQDIYNFEGIQSVLWKIFSTVEEYHQYDMEEYHQYNMEEYH